MKATNSPRKKAIDFILGYKNRVQYTPTREMCFNEGYNEGFNEGLKAFAARYEIDINAEKTNVSIITHQRVKLERFVQFLNKVSNFYKFDKCHVKEMREL